MILLQKYTKIRITIRIFLCAGKLLFMNPLLLRTSFSNDGHGGEKDFVSEVTVDFMDLWTAELPFIFPVS